ncbi:MAG: hypothetical protein LBN27_00130 [Prevotellaceae bacterium]|jgi:hypothetical protein|nr:hypothetical protein [Prevotellaceae bacterium]
MAESLWTQDISQFLTLMDRVLRQSEFYFFESLAFILHFSKKWLSLQRKNKSFKYSNNGKDL